MTKETLEMANLFRGEINDLEKANKLIDTAIFRLDNVSEGDYAVIKVTLGGDTGRDFVVEVNAKEFTKFLSNQLDMNEESIERLEKAFELL